MGRIIFFAGLILTSYGVQAQQILNWINEQYIPSNVNAYDSYAVHDLNGKVKSFQEILVIKTGQNGDAKTLTDCAFLPNGKLDYVDQLLADGSVSKTWFEYHTAVETYHQWWIYLFNSGSGLDTIRYDSLAMTELVPKPDSIFKNEQNQTIYFQLNGESVYSFYDEFGRKTKDSIPGNFLNGMHEINYRYTKKKVIRTENFQSPNLTIKTTFWLDPHGNWTKCTIKNGRKINAVLERSYVYY